MQPSIQECNETCKNVTKHTTMIHVSDINRHVTSHILMMMHSTTKHQVSNDEITSTMNKIMQMQQAHRIQV